MHKEIQIRFNGDSNQILHIGPVQIKGGGVTYLHPQNDVATYKELLGIVEKSKGKIEVKRVKILDDSDEDIKDAVRKPKPEKKFTVTYVGHQLEKPIRGLGSFYQNVPRTDLTKEQIEQFEGSREFVIEEV